MRKVLRQKLVTTQSELEVQQRDPNSPLYSVRSFEELNLRPELLKGTLREYCHFRNQNRTFRNLPNGIQQAVKDSGNSTADACLSTASKSDSSKPVWDRQDRSIRSHHALAN